jgi:DHA1 family multidrug resistance protein-like MFS transporter
MAQATEQAELDVTGGPHPIWRRHNLWPLYAIAVLAELGYAVLNISAMQPYLRYDRQFGESIIALVITVFLLSEAVFKSPMGHLGDRYGRRRLLLVAPCISLCTAVLTTLMRPAIGFIGLRVLDGIGAAMIWPNLFAAVGDKVSDSDRAEAIGVLNMCYWVGIALGPFLDGLVFQFTGNRHFSFYLVALLFGAAALMAFRTIPADGVHPHHEDEAHQIPKLRDLWQVAHEIPGHLALSIVTFFGIGLPMAIFKLYAKDVLQLSDLSFGALLLPAAAAMAFLSMPASRAVNRLGRVKSVQIGLLTGAVGMLIIALTSSQIALAVFGCLVGLGFLVAIPAWLTIASDVNENQRGTYLGAVQTAQGVGALFGASTGGFLYEHVSKNAPFLGTAGALFLAFGLSFLVFRPRRSPFLEQPGQD